MPECYRHPGVETGVSCSSCGRPICPECMTPTPVGMRCPDCSSERTTVVTGVGPGSDDYPATKILIGICVVVYLLEILTGGGGLSAGSSSLLTQFGLRGFEVADGEWYRLITCGFLHASIFHIAFNMVALYFLGRLLEPSIGTPRFLAIYFASLLAGSFGALLLSGSFVNTVGASGAVFGVFGASFVIARGRGLDHIAREIGVILGINLLLTFTVSGISIGGHLGGLVGGLVCGAMVIAGEKGRLGPAPAATEWGVFGIVAAASAVGAVVISEPLPPGVVFGLAIAGSLRAKLRDPKGGATVALLNEEEINEAMAGIDDGWRQEGSEIVRTFRFEDFVGSVRFVDSVVEPAEALAHHPDLSISWNEVEVRISTHSEGGLTAADFELAAKVDALA